MNCQRDLVMPFIRIELIWSTSKVDRVEVRIYIYIYIYIYCTWCHISTHTQHEILQPATLRSVCERKSAESLLQRTPPSLNAAVNQSTPSQEADIPHIIISSHCRNAALKGLLHPPRYKSRPAAPPHSRSSATYLHTCQHTLRLFKLRVLDLNEYFHNHTYSQPETSV